MASRPPGNPDHAKRDANLTRMGANWGNKGGGRPSDQARKLAAKKTLENIDLIAGLIKTAQHDSQKIAAFKALADLGVPKEVIQTLITHDADRLMGCVAAAAAEFFEDESVFDAFLARVEELMSDCVGGSEGEGEDAVPGNQESTSED